MRFYDTVKLCINQVSIRTVFGTDTRFVKAGLQIHELLLWTQYSNTKELYSANRIVWTSPWVLFKRQYIK